MNSFLLFNLLYFISNEFFHRIDAFNVALFYIQLKFIHLALNGLKVLEHRVVISRDHREPKNIYSSLCTS